MTTTDENRAAVMDAMLAAGKLAPRIMRGLRNAKTGQGVKLVVDDAFDGVAAISTTELHVNGQRFVDDFTPSQRAGILVHEAMHKLLRHHERFAPVIGRDSDIDRANNAADYAINAWMIGQGYDLPPDCLYDPQYAGMGAVSDIYPRLPAGQKQPSSGWGKFIPGGNEPSDGDKQEIADAVVGDPGLETLVESELGVKPTRSRVTLTNIMRGLLIRDPEWDCGYNRPGRVRGIAAWYETPQKPRVHVALDVSGSISPEIRAAFLGVMDSVIQPITVSAWDTECKGEWYDIRAGNTTKLQAELPQRGGGTAFQPAIDHVAKTRGGSLIYLTDGQCSERTLNARGLPITWLIWGGTPYRERLEKIGRMIMVEAA